MMLVTGAAGFIGSNLLEALDRRGVRVLAADCFEESPELERRYLPELRPEGLLDRSEVSDWLQRHGSKVEAVVHLGAISDTTVTDRDRVFERNTEDSRRIWSACTAKGIPLVYASSAATYGDGSRGFDDEAHPRVYRPLNLYGESKHRFDLWALEQRRTPPRWVGLKYFNVYGPREGHKGRMASMAFHAYHQAREQGVVRLFESDRPDAAHGDQRRDFVSVWDAVTITQFFLDAASKGAPNGLYNVGTGKARTFNDLARAVFAALGLPPRIEYFPMPEELEGRYQSYTQARVEKLRRAGWSTPFLELEAGVERYVRILEESADAGSAPLAGGPSEAPQGRS